MCNATKVSERTLRNIFQEFFGVGPMRLLKVRQLREIRSPAKVVDVKVRGDQVIDFLQSRNLRRHFLNPCWVSIPRHSRVDQDRLTCGCHQQGRCPTCSHVFIIPAMMTAIDEDEDDALPDLAPLASDPWAQPGMAPGPISRTPKGAPPPSCSAASATRTIARRRR